MKDEFNGVKLFEFGGLKSKMYSLISVDDKEVNKAKGINKKLRHEECVNALLNKKVIRHNMKRIQSKLHGTGTYDVYKISLSCFDDKRYVLNDRVDTLAYFHGDDKNKVNKDDKIKVIELVKTHKVNKEVCFYFSSIVIGVAHY